jgi:hypothetical protein
MSTYGVPNSLIVGDLATVYSNGTSFITKFAVGDSSVLSVAGGAPAGGGQVAMYIGKGSNSNNGFFLSFNHYSDQNSGNFFRILGYGQTGAGFCVTSPGNVGIGTTNPQYTTDSYGYIRSCAGTNSTGAGGGIYFSTNKNTTDYPSIGPMALIKGYLETASGNNNEQGGIVFQVRPVGTSTSLTEAMRISSTGNISIGLGAAAAVALAVQGAPSTAAFNVGQFNNTSGTAILYVQDPGTTAGSSQGWNGAISVLFVGKCTSTGRSISAGGTIFASGADYAEYMTKAGNFTVLKGDLVGVNSSALLTNVFADAVSFVVKSTDPSYVGGDTWGSEEVLGVQKPETVPETDPGYAEYQTKLDLFNTALETARARVDRIAFAGQVPVNVLGATPGQYIVPIAKEDGSIGGQAVSNPTMEQYMAAIGKVIKVLPDGRASVIVKVV